MTSYIVHQTCEHKNNTEEIIKQGGVFADKTELFLGRGYYYWEENSDKAYQWGIGHYKGNYFTFEARLHLDLNFLFDLTYRSHINYLLRIISSYAKRQAISKKIKIGAFIDFIRALQKKEQLDFGTSFEDLPFPFRYSRAIDYLDTPKEVKDRMEFSDREGINGYILLKPCSFFCVYEVIDLHLTDKRLLRESPKRA